MSGKRKLKWTKEISKAPFLAGFHTCTATIDTEPPKEVALIQRFGARNDRRFALQYKFTPKIGGLEANELKYLDCSFVTLDKAKEVAELIWNGTY